MKKAYRKDVIIARVVFVAFCLVIAMLIVCAVIFARNHMAQKQAEVQETQTQTQTETEETQQQAEQDTEEEAPDIEEEQQEETTPLAVTTADVNLRTEPNTSCEVITVIPKGTQVEFLGEEDGWASVNYGDETGYVSTDYIEEVTDSE
ncbi:MAG: SH3 domain-containing protein [Clostridiales bacterium]|nr:SH3 domain-containing protein [Clostridiales bacterium]